MTKQVYTLSPGTPEERTITLSPSAETPGNYLVTIATADEEKSVEVNARELKAGSWSLLINHESFQADCAAQDDLWSVNLQGSSYEHHLYNARQMRRLASGGGAAGANAPELKSPMAGKVIQVLVEEGQSVEAGDKVMVIEAMKMENEIKAHRPGVVASISVAAGNAVEVGATLLTIEDAPEE